MNCTLCGESVANDANFFRTEDGKRTHAKCLYVKDGYDAAIADVAAWLKGTNVGEFSVPRYLAPMIERGDAKGAAKKAAGSG